MSGWLAFTLGAIAGAGIGVIAMWLYLIRVLRWPG